MKHFIIAILILSAATAWCAAPKPFPAHWGEPPKIQTHDYVQLPGGYGHGSSTLANWIARNLAQDQAKAQPADGAQPKPLFEMDFEAAETGKLPEGFLVLNGAFAVQSVGTNKFLETPGAPVDDYALLFGPTQKEGVSVQARVYGTSTGRRYPVLAVGLNGLGGYELQLAPAKRALELFKGEDRIASVPCRWETGTWTVMRLQVRKAGDALWKIEGKVWKHGTPEPADWMIVFDESTEPPMGRASISGHPFSGTPIRFDDLLVRTATGGG